MNPIHFGTYRPPLRDRFFLDLAEKLEPPDDDPKADVSDWEDWISTIFPGFATYDFADHHRQVWDWAWSIEDRVPINPMVAVWARGGAKSTIAEMISVAVGAKKTRRYILYVCETQEQANDHLEEIGTMLESTTVEHYYPSLASRKVGKYGSSRGWRRTRLRTASGLIIDALGLDKAKRGVKLDGMRPDLFIFDDIDGKHDSEFKTQKKIEKITTSILPSGSEYSTSLWVQNLIHSNSIFNQIVKGEAGFLYNATISGPVPALENFTHDSTEDEQTGRIRYRVLTGDPTWEGQDVATCEKFINEYGPAAFKKECQHEVDELIGGLFEDIEFRRVATLEAPRIDRSIVYVDPATTNKKASSCQGIAVAGIDHHKIGHLQYAWEGRMQPRRAIRKAIQVAVQVGAMTVWIEGNQGGDTWLDLADLIWEELVKEELLTTDRRGANRIYLNKPKFEKDTASKSKPTRHEELHTAYSLGQIVHILGPHEAAETALNRLTTGGTQPIGPLDLADAIYGVMSKLIQMSKSAGWSKAKRFSDPRNKPSQPRIRR